MNYFAYIVTIYMLSELLIYSGTFMYQFWPNGVIMIKRNKKAVSPVISTILIIALTVAAVVSVVTVLYVLTSSDDTPLIRVPEVSKAFDYNDDNKVDALEIKVVNEPGRPSGPVELVIIRTESEEFHWQVVWGNANVTYPSSYTMIISAKSLAEQIERNTQYSILLFTFEGEYMSTSTFSGASTLLKTDPVTVTVTNDGVDYEGALIVFEYYYTSVTGEKNWIPIDFYTATSTDSDGKVEADLFVGTYRVIAYTGESQTDPIIFNRFNEDTINISLGGGKVLVKVVDAEGSPMEGIHVFATDKYKVDLSGVSTATNATGELQMLFSSGEYYLRATYLGDDYFSSKFTIPGTTSVTIVIRAGTIEIKVLSGGDLIPSGNLFRLYTQNNVSVNKYDYSNSSGYITYTGVSNGLYRLRWDTRPTYQWSRVFSTAESTIEIDFGGGDLTILVTANGDPLPGGVLTRLYSATNTSASKYDYLNSSGYTEYGPIAPGSYRLRIDWLNDRYWTVAFSHMDPEPKEIDIGGGVLIIQVLAGGEPLPSGVLTRLRDTDNSSASLYRYTNSTGFVNYGTIPASSFRLRVDWLSRYYYTDIFTHDGSVQYLDIGGGNLIVQLLAGGQPLTNGILTRLRKADNTSASLYRYTNGTGFVNYGAIPEEEYRIRVDWLGKYFYTEIFVHDGSVQYLDIGGGKLIAQILANGDPLPSGILTRLRKADNTSASLYRYTNGTGFVDYGAIPESNYRIRVDWLGKYFYTEIFAHDGSVQYLDIGGGTLLVQLTANGEALPNGILTRLRKADNSSASLYRYTNGTGFVDYGAIPEGEYRLRIDWLNQYFYTEIFLHDGTVQQLDVGGGLLVVHLVMDGYSIDSGVLTRLRKSDNSSASLYRYTNGSGIVNYGAIPEGDYRLRIDWLNQYFYTEIISHTNSTLKEIDLGGGYLIIQFISDGSPVSSGNQVRLYINGNYASKYTNTNATGHAVFIVPAHTQYSARLTYSSNYYYTNTFVHESNGTTHIHDIGMVSSSTININSDDTCSNIFSSERIILQEEILKR